MLTGRGLATARARSDESGETMFARLQRYFFAGALTAIPIWVTFLVCRFILEAMAGVSMPAVRRTFPALEGHLPWIRTLLDDTWFQWTAALIITLVLMVSLGWIATNVAGRRVVHWAERTILRIPVVQQVYGSTKKLIDALQSKPEGVKRVVMIEFPSKGMKTIGLVTKTMTDRATGRQLAAVYVPTTPNPTSGYLEIVPREALVDTDWTMDEAMSFVISGGAVSRDEIDYHADADADAEPER